MSDRELQAMMQENKMQMLVDQNTELTKQIDMLKRTNNMLLDSLKQAEAQYQQVYLAQLAHGERSDQLEHERRRHEQTQQVKQRQIIALKEELKEKDRHFESMRIEYERQLFKREQDLASLKQRLKRELDKRTTCQNQLHDLTITHNDSPSSLQEEMWGGSTRFSLPENNMNRANVIESHAMQYMKKSKEEIKIAMKAMIKAERSLEAGNLESSFIRTAYKVPK